MARIRYEIGMEVGSWIDDNILRKVRDGSSTFSSRQTNGLKMFL